MNGNAYLTIAAACIALYSSGVSAQDGLAGRLHVSLEARLVSAAVADYDVGGDVSSSSSVRLGFPLAGAARVGYAPRERLELGGTLGLFVGRENTDDSVNSSRDLDLAAYLRYIAGGDRARFFIGPTMGLRFFSSAPDEDPGWSGSQFAIGADLGLYGVVTPSLSIDPFFSLTYFVGSQQVDGEPSGSAMGFRLVLGAALSGWIKVRNG